MAINKTRALSDLAIPPGEMLEEELDVRGIRHEEMATALDLPLEALNEIFQGQKPITLEIAIRLESALGIGSDFWINLEADYRATLERVGRRET